MALQPVPEPERPSDVKGLLTALLEEVEAIDFDDFPGGAVLSELRRANDTLSDIAMILRDIKGKL